MQTRRFAVAMAALVLGLELGSPATASLRVMDLDAMAELIVQGDVDAVMAMLAMYPGLLDLDGALGDAIRSFFDDPSPWTLAAIASVAGNNVAVAIRAAACTGETSCY